jgi:hypothetical protein
MPCHTISSHADAQQVPVIGTERYDQWHIGALAGHLDWVWRNSCLDRRPLTSMPDDVDVGKVGMKQQDHYHRQRPSSRQQHLLRE